MTLATMHIEDVKAEIKKRYGTVAKFERAKKLPAKSVAEVLRGRSWKRVAEAIDTALTEPIPPNDLYEGSDSSRPSDSHRLIAVGR